ncbi:hypothetical protein CBNV_gp040 [Clanis bilineata nucleopolyhedrovirus]|uniref:Uncharacterized protein n=1 Tax=Clanis bilineata nucleopolyhedrovirus TaxID=1307957 RepID=Q0N460_9ABAC|nr:hypothetical protein CBNV_gp040 [Clanis bilineata nucleopolyhedrovirus]ABF47383.1 hypothetical protein [Clanis bilineata nucleopolyhedrovirus]
MFRMFVERELRVFGTHPVHEYCNWNTTYLLTKTCVKTQLKLRFGHNNKC